jgi:hypothetical protein
VGLYEEPERPTSPMDYIKRYIGAPKNIDVDGLKRENEQLKRQLAALSLQQGSNTNATTTTTNSQKTSVVGVDGGEKTNTTTTTTTTSDNKDKKKT